MGPALDDRDAAERRPGDLADHEPAVPGEPGQRRRAARRRGHDVDRGRLLPVPQRRAGRQPTRASSPSSTRRVPSTTRPRRSSLEPTRPRPSAARPCTLTANAERRLRRQARHVLRRRRAARHGRAAAVHGARSRSRRMRVCDARADASSSDSLGRPSAGQTHADGRLHRDVSRPVATAGTAGRSADAPAATLPRSRSGGAPCRVGPFAPGGLAPVDFFLGTRKVCTAPRAPYECQIRPTGADVGTQALRVVVTDRSASRRAQPHGRRSSASRSAALASRPTGSAHVQDQGLAGRRRR